MLGVTAGLSPGPLLTLVVSQTLRHGIREGAKVAMVPLVTDFPLIIGAAFFLARLPDYRTPLGVVSIIGGLFVLYLAYGSFRAVGIEIAAEQDEPRSFRKGVMVNALNPNFYIFWLTVGTPLVLKGWTDSPLAAVSFIAGFMSCIVGTKVTMAVLAGKSRQFLVGASYRYLLRFLGIILAGFALMLIREGLGFLGLEVLL
jgi:threonine/homoserine/homoserine lactone efflux protein